MIGYILLFLCLPCLARCTNLKHSLRSRLEEVEVKLFIFSEYNYGKGLEVPYGNPQDHIPAMYYDKLKTNVFLIPGSNSYEFGKRLSQALLNTEEANVFLFEWIPEDNVDSRWREKSIGDAGLLITKFILKLKKTLDLSVEDTQLVGEGIGAHVAGLVGRRLRGRIQGIVALDPTYPPNKHGSKLMKTDAKVVEVIHTEGTKGYPFSMGAIDFFVNGGSKQPGCETQSKSQKSCSHNRAWAYYEESLKGGVFMGFSCPKYKFVKYLELEQCDGTFALMGGLHISQKPTGDFYVKTNAEPEFALLQKNSVFER